ncbi:TspO/MBR family protein [Alteraurantiacibacter palmitatis]|uniref:TspO/MBR family protein n=1 Tax=Alteraurantiacibacter palmitatis TaxID=2054628 RepID=A0ABV7E570_9SPHN
MNRLATPGQLRASLLRWSLFLVPTVLLLGFMSGQFAGSGPGNPWFDALEKPAIYPPPAAFGIVWSILYVMMGVALAMVCAAWGARWRPWAILAFVVQLALNLAWSPVFFAMHDIPLALAVILTLLAALVLTIWLFAKVRRAAAWLLVPYLAWVCFATVLTWQFLELNPNAAEIEVNNAVQRIEL